MNVNAIKANAKTTIIIIEIILNGFIPFLNKALSQFMTDLEFDSNAGEDKAKPEGNTFVLSSGFNEVLHRISGEILSVVGCDRALNKWYSYAYEVPAERKKNAILSQSGGVPKQPVYV